MTQGKHSMITAAGVGLMMRGASVLAIGAGHKRQTRRVMDPQPTDGIPPTSEAPWPIGGIRWVKESFAFVDKLADNVEREHPMTVAYQADRRVLQFYNCEPDELPGSIALDARSWNWERVKWKSPLFLPRWASRFALRCTNIRAERVQEISEQDALAEGMDAASPRQRKVDRRRRHDDDREDPRVVGYSRGSFAVQNYRDAWNEINGQRRMPNPDWRPARGPRGRTMIDTSISWDGNPWVWAYTFERAREHEGKAL